MQDDDIDKELLTPADEVSGTEEFAPKKRSVKKAKPTLEGINTPKITNNNVVVRSAQGDEREQILLPKRINQKTHHIGRWFSIFIVLLILIGVVYEIYIWNINKNILPVPGYTSPITANPNPAVSNPYLGTTPTATSTTSTPITSTSTPATTTVPTVIKTQLTINQTPTGYLNVRSAPASSGQQIGQVHPGETYPFTATQSGWYKITLTDGTTGWVSGQYVTVVK